MFPCELLEHHSHETFCSVFRILSCLTFSFPLFSFLFFFCCCARDEGKMCSSYCLLRFLNEDHKFWMLLGRWIWFWCTNTEFKYIQIWWNFSSYIVSLFLSLILCNMWTMWANNMNLEKFHLIQKTFNWTSKISTKNHKMLVYITYSCNSTSSLYHPNLLYSILSSLIIDSVWLSYSIFLTFCLSRRKIVIIPILTKCFCQKWQRKLFRLAVQKVFDRLFAKDKNEIDSVKRAKTTTTAQWKEGECVCVCGRQ